MRLAFMTIHAAKGLEFDGFCIGLEGMVPSSKSIEERNAKKGV